MNPEEQLRNERIKSNLKNTEKALSEAQKALDHAKELMAESRKKRGASVNETPLQITYSREQYLRSLKYETAFAYLALMLIIFLFGGLILEWTLGENFIFAFGNEYRELQIKLFFVLYPIITITGFFYLRVNTSRWAQFSARKLYWLLFPLISACFTILPLAAPLGWAAFSGRVIGSNSENLEASIISVAPKNNSSKRSCTQRAELEFRGNSAELCTDGLIVGDTPQQNEKVLISGQVSWLGIYIQQIRSQPQ